MEVGTLYKITTNITNMAKQNTALSDLRSKSGVRQTYLEECSFKKFPMHEMERHTTITEATSRHTDDFRTDGKKLFQLPFPIMRFDVNFPAINHSEVAPDTNPFTWHFLTDYSKALSRARFCEYNFHDFERYNGSRAKTCV